ncbi:UbiH/UbiF family hydroxylase [Roseivivax sp. THAF197b]|uniref:UbiH/UbiF family hydroxylase n=1 Tax=Roseivivax sp. THAF197b TaxID=2588299 RepID=UPI0012A90B56|nr:UbiH/UbiF family hydroxylase [Roseivivax sp. THAF197b]QFS82279.1 2-octaprenyl-3-methyl-6-methoxy-1,4-benzoquinol hydroxylase [Roseivivax sp. THAF197b]
MDHDILISGGGIAGMSAAAAFGRAGFSVLCVDPAPPVTERDADGADLRTTAFLQPARDFLDRAGLWARLSDHATPLQVMRIADASRSPPMTRDFNAADISDLPFGWNLPNWLLRREMAKALDEMPGVDFRPGTATKSLFTRTGEARVGLSDGTRPRVKLVIAADGRGSPMRQAAGIGVTTTRYGQKALAFAVTHDAPHGNVSTEIHRAGGPFTLVPLPDHDGRPSSAVVWMMAARDAERRAALDVPAFEAEMTDRSAGLYGPLKLASKRNLWPIITQGAERLTAQRLALVAEAAHVMPPIGAQGLNMSLRDLETLLDLAVAAPERLGDAAMLDAYEKKRAPDIRLRMSGISALNRASMQGLPTLQAARATGLGLLHDLAPMRKAVMELGLGAKAR